MPSAGCFDLGYAGKQRFRFNRCYKHLEQLLECLTTKLCNCKECVPIRSFPGWDRPDYRFAGLPPREGYWISSQPVMPVILFAYKKLAMFFPTGLTVILRIPVAGTPDVKWSLTGQPRDRGQARLMGARYGK